MVSAPDEYVDSSLFYKYPDAYRSVFLKVWFLEIPSPAFIYLDLIQRIKDKGGLISFITSYMLHQQKCWVQQKNTKQNA